MAEMLVEKVVVSAREERLAAMAAGLPRVAFTPDEAAASLGVSRDTFDRHVKKGGLRVVRCGSCVLVPVKELERWLDANAVRVLE